MSVEYAGKTILVVDDDRDMLLSLQLQLEGLGFRTVTAQSQREAEAWLETASPDIAIFDLMLENLDGGFILCHRLKHKDAAIPVILLTGVTSETGIEFETVTDEERGWIKADAILAKPIRFEQLRREIDRLLQ
jgi:CheY-like chemotaxis protein